jgi:hypothetical protein
MASPKKTNGSGERRVLYARLPSTVFSKLEKLAASRTAKAGRRVTLQDTVIELIREAGA